MLCNLLTVSVFNQFKAAVSWMQTQSMSYDMWNKDSEPLRGTFYLVML